jgi:hypothetical protein
MYPELTDEQVQAVVQSLKACVTTKSEWVSGNHV